MKRSLSTNIALIVFGLVAIGGGLTAFLVYKNSTGALQTSISNNQTDQAKQTMDKIDRFLYERMIDMESISGRQQIQDFLSLPASQRSPVTAAYLSKQLEDFKVSTGVWSELTLLDSQGNVPLPTNLQGFKDILAKNPSVLKLYASAAAGQRGYSDALSVAKGHEPIMLFMAPIRNQQIEGQPIIGILVGEVAWQANLDILKDLNGTSATLANNKGLSLGENIATPPDELLSKDFSSSPAFKAAQKNTSGSGVFPGLDEPKNSFVTSYVKEAGFLDYHGNNWTLMLEMPRSAAFAPAYQLAKKLIIIFSGILILSVLAILAALRFLILKPIVNLKEVTGRLSDGDFSQRTSIKSNDELGKLGQDFNDMADKIQLAYANLEKTTEEARGEKSILETLLNNLPVGVLVVKAPSGEPIMMNHAGEQISGRGMNTNIGWSEYSQTYQVLNEDDTPYPAEELPLTITLKTGRTAMKDDMVMQRPDGTKVAVRAITTPIKAVDGSIERAVSVFEDISTERELERSRDEFFSIASHELRTPLTAIMGNSSLIQQYYNDKLPDDDVREMISDIHESSLRLIEIVNDFLDTSRLEQKHMKYETVAFNVVDVAKSVVKEYQVTGSRKKIHLEVLEPQPSLALVKADQNRTKQVLINLVGNAMKFTSSGTVTISFKPELKFIKVLIKDNGQGMSVEAQKLLFHKFEQTGSTVLTRDSVRGTGLGLYISKLIIEQMGGSIHLESSKPGVGTTFSFSLPISPDNKETTSKDKA